MDRYEATFLSTKDQCSIQRSFDKSGIIFSDYLIIAGHIIRMDGSSVDDIVNQSLCQLYEDDQFLLQERIHERTIAHKFAEYLQYNLEEVVINSDLIVDCEYNREGHDDRETLPAPENTHEKELDEDTIFPDIIIHKRGSSDKNILVIEVKKSDNSDNRKSDRKRLQKLTTDREDGRFGYEYGLFLVMPVGINWEEEKTTIEWYQDGEIQGGNRFR